MTKIALNNEAGDRIALKIAKGFIRIQLLWSKWMLRQSERIPLKTRKLVFAGFGASLTFCCVFLIVKNPDKKQKHFHIPGSPAQYSGYPDNLLLMEHIYQKQ